MAKRARLSARYGNLERSPDQPWMSSHQKLMLAGLVVIGITGGLIWIGGMSVEREGDSYRIVRKHRARPAAEAAPTEAPTTRADGRLVG